MLEFNVQRKQKICLSDYDYKQDVNNRILMAHFTSCDLAVLQEILYSPLRISTRKLAKNCAYSFEEVLSSLEKFAQAKLITMNGDGVDVDKNARKYFESEVHKFDPDFQPGMDYLLKLLKKVPIHVLPTWYTVPRTTNNIFDSLVEHYFLTPHIYQRHLSEVRFYEPTIAHMMEEVFQAPRAIKAQDLIKKYQLSHETFEEYLLLLEFHFACFVCYEKVGDAWEESITPFHEWRTYLEFLRNTEAKPINSANIQRLRPHDFSFVEDLSALLQCAKKRPIAFEKQQDRDLPMREAIHIIAKKCNSADEKDPAFIAYLEKVIHKATLLKLAEVVDHKLYALDAANAWIDLSLENRALFCYRHPLNRLTAKDIPLQLCTEKFIREAEKSILRVLHSGWVFFEDFMRGVTVPLNETSLVILQKKGRTWEYQLPKYKEEEMAFIKAIVLEWLFEAGVIAVGTCEGRDCFTVTSFGQSLFG